MIIIKNSITFASVVCISKKHDMLSRLRIMRKESADHIDDVSFCFFFAKVPINKLIISA